MALSDRELFLRFMEKSLPPSTFPGEGEDHKPIIRHLVPDMQQEAPLLFHGSLPEHINPSGLDLTIGNLIVESDTLITDLTEEEFFQMKPTELEDGEQQVLHPDRNGERIYYISNQERINFPPDLETIVDARSTTGRVGCMCHDVGSLSTGERIIAVQPLAFPLLVTSGLTRLAQAIVRYKETGFLSYETLEKHPEYISFSRNGEDIFQQALDSRGLVMTLSTHLAYRAKDCTEPIDMDAVNKLDPNLYFEIQEGNHTLAMDARRFYLAGTQEVIAIGNVCGRISRESHISGTGLWSHFAGYVMPGFTGPITLECYSLGKRTLKKGHPAGFVIFDEVEGEINNLYNGSYQNQQVPKLPKMFKET